MLELKFGSKAKDKITGFTGTITGHATYAHRGPEWLVEAAWTVDGSPQKEWIPETRIEVVSIS